MKTIFYIFILSCAFFPQYLFASVGHRGLSINGTHRFISLEVKDEQLSPEKSKVSANYSLLKLNYTMNSGISLGSSFYIVNETNDRVNDLGFHFGYAYEGFSFHVNYFNDPERKENNSNTLNKDGSLIVYELSYHYNVLPHVYLGLNLSYSQEKYSKLENSGTTIDSEFILNSLQPFITIGFLYNPFEGSGSSYR